MADLILIAKKILVGIVLVVLPLAIVVSALWIARHAL